MTYKLGIQHETKRELDLLPHEIAERTQVVLGMLKERAELAEEKKRVQSGYSARLKGLDEAIERVRKAVETKKEERTLMVVWVHAGDREQLVDVGNRDRIIEQRPLTQQRDWVEEAKGKNDDGQGTPDGNGGGSGGDPAPAKDEGALEEVAPNGEEDEDAASQNVSDDDLPEFATAIDTSDAEPIDRELLDANIDAADGYQGMGEEPRTRKPKSPRNRG